MEDSRNHILQTALKLFLEKSFKAVTFQELMGKTGFSKGAFFYYFKNKQEIFEAAIDMYIDLASVDFSQLSHSSLRDFLRSYFPETRKRRASFFAPEFTFAANHYSLMFEAMRIIPDFKSKINRHEDIAIAAWMNIIAAARKNQEIKTVLSDIQLARLFIDAAHGIVLHLIMADNTTALEKETSKTWNNIYLLIKN